MYVALLFQIHVRRMFVGFYTYQWIGLRDVLQENPRIFMAKIHGFQLRCALKPFYWIFVHYHLPICSLFKQQKKQGLLASDPPIHWTITMKITINRYSSLLITRHYYYTITINHYQPLWITIHHHLNHEINHEINHYKSL